MNKLKKILLVDDNKSFIEALKLILKLRNDVEVIGEAFDGREFLDFLSIETPDIVLLDINMPVINGISAARISLKQSNQLKIIGVTMSDNIDLHIKMKEAGFSGAILKNNFSDHFDKALKAIDNGEIFFPTVN